MLLKKLQEFQNAIDDLMAILEKMPNPQFFFEIGNLYQNLNNKDKSCEFWNEGASRNHQQCKELIEKHCN